MITAADVGIAIAFNLTNTPAATPTHTPTATPLPSATAVPLVVRACIPLLAPPADMPPPF